MHVDNEGKLTPVEKVRTKKKVIERIVERMKENAVGGTDYNGKCGRVWKDLRAIWKFGFTKNNVTLFKDGQKYF